MRRREFLWLAGGGMASFALAPLYSAETPHARPNILFFFPDQHRGDWTSMNASLPGVTPNLKVLARRGVCFSNALTPSPLCAPARACLTSGREYARCGVADNAQPYPLDQATVYGLLRKGGYRVLGCGKFDLDKPGASWGIDGKHTRPGQPSLLEAWGFTGGVDNAGKTDGAAAWRKGPKPEPYFAYLRSRNLVQAHLENLNRIEHDYPGESLLPEDAYCDNWIARNGLELLRGVPQGEPWFLQVNFNGAHTPMDVTKPMWQEWKDAPLPEACGHQARTDMAVRRNYAAMIDNIDRWLGIYLAEIERRGESGRTLVVYCSDHGEMLGDQGLWGKKQPYHPSVRVPLVVAGPGVRENQAPAAPVQTLDLTATFLDYAGISRPEGMDSRSLRPFLEKGGELPRRHAVSSIGGWSMVFDGRYKLIQGRWGGKGGAPKASAARTVLYDLETDPCETTDVAPTHPSVIARLKTLLPPVNPYRIGEAVS